MEKTIFQNVFEMVVQTFLKHFEFCYSTILQNMLDSKFVEKAWMFVTLETLVGKSRDACHSLEHWDACWIS